MRQIDPEIFGDFAVEMKAILPEIWASLEAVSIAENLDEVLEPASRHAHNIAGTAIMLNLEGISKLAEHFEEGLLAVREGRQLPSEGLLALWHDSTLTLENAIPRIAQGEGAAVDVWTDLLARYAELLVPATPSNSPAPIPASPAAAPKIETDQVAPELREVFAMEAEDHLRTIHTSLTRVAAHPGDLQAIQEIRRSAHTLKGSAAIVGFRSIAQLAHRMEDLLDEISEVKRTVTPTILDVLVRSADLLEGLAVGEQDRDALAAIYIQYQELLPKHESTSVAAPVAVEMVAVPENEVEVPAETELQPVAGGGQYLRVPQERLDSVVKLVSELVITRSTLEQRLAEFDRLVGELRLSNERLRRSSSKLEVGYEARALAGGRAYALPDGSEDGPISVTNNTYGFDDLEFDRYTDFHLLTRELSETTTDVSTVGQEFSNLHRELDGLMTRQSRLTSEIQDGLMRLRMVPFAALASRLSRTVRGTARQLDKQVELILEGERTELDKTVLEELAEPLLHLIRNAIDHGIESPARRLAAGKDAHGTLRVKAYPDGTQIVLTVTDDGAGMNLDAIRATAIQRGLITADQAALLPDAEVQSLVFQPGFSTAAAVTEVSGRGVGLDVVKSKVHQLEGTVEIESHLGAGTVFTLRLPLTLAVIRALLVRAAGQTFALPLTGVTQILRLEPTETHKIGTQPFLKLGKSMYPLIWLSRALNLPATGRDEPARPPVIVMRAGGREVGLVVDTLLGGREIVLKTLGSHLRRVHGVAGATLLGDGSVVLVVNPSDLVRDEDARPEFKPQAPKAVIPSRNHALNILIVDDSPSVRRVVAQLMQSAGWVPTQAKDGIEALEILNHSAQLPDLILMDVEMPRMDGYELLATVRAQPAWKALPVVMVTSRSGDKHRTKAMELGASAYLVKPYQDELLLRKIRELTRATVQG